jgi:hypothetical protein
MYKLVFIILTLSGFLFYKAFTVGRSLKPAYKTAVNQTVAKPVLKPSEIKSSKIQEKKIPAVAASGGQTPTQPEQIHNDERSDYDSLSEVFREAEPIPDDKLTPEEQAAHEANLKLMKEIEARADAARNIHPGRPKSPEQLTPEELKNFEIYNSFEKKDNSDADQ